MAHHAGVIQREGHYVVYCWARRMSGSLTVSEPVMRIDSGNAADLGRAIRTALHEGPEKPVPDRTPGEGFQNLRPVLKSLKIRSWAALTRGSRSISIVEDGPTITLLPSENKGARTGFIDRPEYKDTLSAEIDDATLGSAAIKTLAEFSL